MKVGVLTYHYAYNYGAVLQCLALQRTLTKLGLDSEVINYLPPQSRELPFWRGWGIFKKHKFRNIQQRLIFFRYGPAMRECFHAFRNEYLKLSSLCTSNGDVAKIINHYDAVIAGSDQIWRFTQPSVYFLEWGSIYSGKRISYAASCGTEEQPRHRLEDVGKWLNQVNYLSVRDEFSRKIVYGATGRNPEVVADPTLLADLSDIQKSIHVPYQKYIFAYIIGEEIIGNHSQIIKMIRQKYCKLPIVAVVASAHQPQKALWADHIIWDAGPCEWLYLLANAAFIYTDSFHGSLFAIKYKKPFLAYYIENIRAPRLVDIGERYAVSSYIVGSADEAMENRFWIYPDYNKTCAIINSHVKDSFAYLKTSLGL